MPSAPKLCAPVNRGSHLVGDIGLDVAHGSGDGAGMGGEEYGEVVRSEYKGIEAH